VFRSIRHKLFAAIGGLTVLVCVCYTGLALVIAYVTEDMVVGRLLEREASAIAAQFRAHGGVTPPAGDLIRVYPSIEALPSAVRAHLLSGHERGEIFTDTGQHYHLRTLDLDSGAARQRIYLLADAAPILVVSKLIQDVGGVLIVVALALVGLALLLAWLLSRRLVLPLQVLANEVRKRNLETGGAPPFSASGRRDEIGYLADKLGATIAELHAALAREHAFTRDVGHELRTPLTVMNNTLHHAASRPLAGDDVRQLRSNLDEVRNTIDVLFALARAEHVGSEVLDLRGCIEDSLLRLPGVGDWNEEQLALDLPDRLAVTGNRHLCMLLMNNCLGNALFHGGPAARLRLSFSDGVLSIANTVDAGNTGTMQGFLHGQNLVLRIAAAMRWELRFHAGGTDYRVDIVPLRAS
jgi:signal transduction histidine kinase